VFLMKTLFISEAGPDTHILIIVNNSLSSVGKHGRIGYLCTSNYFNWIFSSKIKHNISETSLHTYQLPINLFIPATPRYHTRKHPTETTGEGLNLGKKKRREQAVTRVRPCTCHLCLVRLEHLVLESEKDRAIAPITPLGPLHSLFVCFVTLPFSLFSFQVRECASIQ
jgi:hypothetical protein